MWKICGNAKGNQTCGYLSWEKRAWLTIMHRSAAQRTTTQFWLDVTKLYSETDPAQVAFDRVGDAVSAVGRCAASSLILVNVSISLSIAYSSMVETGDFRASRTVAR